MQFSIRNTTKRRASGIRFEYIKDKVLGKNYELSLVFCGNALSRKLNKNYRNKDKATNVLAFPLAKNSGEIFINLANLKNFSVRHLFIHALLHLKGMQHGDTMDKAEKKLLNGTPNHRRN